ncbi:MAG TPA: immunoglobulin domain-containing protein [Clostridia bacterium]|nr:immunoglobulin domain-containing protein [Clostridia bacterium]
MNPLRTAQIAAACLVAGFGLTRVNAASLMFDFGPTAVQPADATKSPAHAGEAIPLTEISWNSSIIGDSSGPFVYSDGTSAAGITLNIGRGLDGVDTIEFSSEDYRNAALGGAYNLGIYSGSSPAKDGVFGAVGASAANNVAVGLRIDGLAAGTYTLYVHGRNTSSSDTLGATPERLYAKAGPSAESYSFSAADVNTVIPNSVPANTTAFVVGNNYNTLTIQVGAGQSLFVAAEGTTSVERRGFINTLQIVAASEADKAAKISVQPPATVTVLEGMNNLVITAQAQGELPVARQWRFNGMDLPGATSDVLTLSNISLSMAGNYSLFATNVYGTALSSDCVLTVLPVLNTPQMTNIWNLYADERVYISPTNNNERGFAYNPLTTNLLVVSRSPSESVVVLDARTGAEKHFLSVNGVTGTVPGQTLGLNMIGVTDTGLVLAANLTANASSTVFYLYGWLTDEPGVDPALLFAGDPGQTTIPGLRYGDNMIVRGSGPSTQIFMASGTNVIMFRTETGLDFQSLPPAMIPITGVPSNFAQLGLAFGPEDNQLWGKTAYGQLYLVQFDLVASTGAVVTAYSPAAMPGSVRGLGSSQDGKWLAGVSLQTPDSVRLYDISDLERGPVQNDEELFAVKNANGTLSGTAFTVFGGDYLFALDSNNGLKAFLIDTNYQPTGPLITVQPVSQTVMETAAAVTFGVQALGAEPLAYQWHRNGTDISGASSSTLTLTNVQLSAAGDYGVLVSNVYGTALSSNAVLTVTPIVNTMLMSNIWSILPGQQVYVGTNNTERGLAYNPVRTNLLLVSRAPAESVVVLNALTGAEKHFLDVTGIPGSIPNVSLGLNLVGVAEDGAVFGGSVTVVGNVTPYYLYRWPDDGPGVMPTVVYLGNPGDTAEPGIRWGDTLAVRGAGATTQVLLGPATGTNVVLLRTAGGVDFQYEVPPTVLAISGVHPGFCAVGVAFGAGNTFWAKGTSNVIYHVQFDLTANTGAVLHAYSEPVTLGPLRGLSVNAAQKYLAGVSMSTPDNVHIYDISNPAIGPVLRDQELFPIDNPNGTVNFGTASTAFGGDYLFALDTNNGLKAFYVDPDFVPPVTAFRISAATRSGADLVLTWESVPGQGYQVQSRQSLTTGDWVNEGAVIQASGATTSFTNDTAGASSRFYRIRGQ